VNCAILIANTAFPCCKKGSQTASAIIVPRTRFAPVKATADLLALRSDAYIVTEDWRILLANLGAEPPPAIDLDSDHYRLVDQLDAKLAGGVPSLKDCRELRVRGPVLFQKGNVFRGKVSVSNGWPSPVSCRRVSTSTVRWNYKPGELLGLGFE
jgi:UTP--glucose-1-phosphate uridylyltransferase